MTEKKYIVAGASAAGISAVKEIISADPSADIILVSDEDHNPYHRPMLSELIADKSIAEKNSFYLNKPEWYNTENLKFIRSASVSSIDRMNRTAELSTGESLHYDRLILAVGSRPFIPVKPGPDNKRVFSLRTYSDAMNISTAALSAGSAAVIGGGLLGLEAAYSLKKIGLRVTIIELSERIMPLQLDVGGSDFLYQIIKERGANLMLSESVDSYMDNGISLSLKLRSSNKIDADLMLISAGVRPNTDLAVSCGLAVNKGVVVDKFMATSDPDIFACGDLTELNGRLLPLWMPAVKKGKIAGSNAAGRVVEYHDEIYPFAISAFGTKIFSAGNISPAEGYGVENFTKKTGSSYSNIIFINGVLAGFVLIGDTLNSQKYLKALHSSQGIDALRSGGLI